MVNSSSNWAQIYIPRGGGAGGRVRFPEDRAKRTKPHWKYLNDREFRPTRDGGAFALPDIPQLQFEIAKDYDWLEMFVDYSVPVSCAKRSAERCQCSENAFTEHTGRYGWYDTSSAPERYVIALPDSERVLDVPSGGGRRPVRRGHWLLEGWELVGAGNKADYPDYVNRVRLPRPTSFPAPDARFFG